MSALAEALVAAQRRALAAMEKQFVARSIETQECLDLMESIGLTDKIDQARLIVALDAIRQYGAQLPAEANGAPAEKGSEPATAAQLTLIGKLAKEKHFAEPDGPLTKAQAHEIIDTLKAGTYDPAKWTVPF